jgi:hypothetical protein
VLNKKMNKPNPPKSKIGNEVKFKPPIGAGENISPRKGKIVDEIWSGIYPDQEWGHYIYTSQLIQWDNGQKSIRLTYYYCPHGKERWIFGGQFSIEDKPEIINKLLSATLEKKWK